MLLDGTKFFAQGTPQLLMYYSIGTFFFKLLITQYVT